MSNPDFALAESVPTTEATYFILVYLLVLIYCCFGLAVVCDVYFVPALQKLSYAYDLPPDIAGSTLMALGASVPELFASLIGVFVTEDDIGTGSIIGSSCFNLIAVPAACAFVASATFNRKLPLSPVPVMRNSAFYAITMLVLLLIIKDNKVDIPEAVILLLFFVMYMGFMIFCAQTKSCPDSLQNSLTYSYSNADSAIAECNYSEKGKCKGKGNNDNDNFDIRDTKLDADSKTEQLIVDRQQQQQQQQQQLYNYNNRIPNIYGNFYFDFKARDNEHVLNNSDRNSNLNLGANERTPLVKSSPVHIKQYEYFQTDNNLHTQQPTDERMFSSNQIDSVSLNLGLAVKNSTCLVRNLDYHNQHHHPFDGEKLVVGGDNHFDHEDTWLHSKWVLVPMLPVTLSMKILTPLKFKNTCWTIWTFLVSIALIGGLTYISVWVVHMFGQTVGIPETVAGMTILSWGTGIPELIASIVLIKKTSQADMAICNTIGSNVIDASFCLSLPWIVKCILNKAAGMPPEVKIQSAALPWTSFTLLLTVLLLIIVLKLNDWMLSFRVGVWLTFIYITFVGVATHLESSYSETGLDLMSML